MVSHNSSSPFPPADAEGCIARNVRRIAHMDIPGGAQIVSKGNIVFVAHMLPPHGTSIIDVADPKNPSLLASVKLDGDHSHSHKVGVAGDLMVVNSQRNRRKFFRKAEKLAELETRLSSNAEIAAELGVKAQDVPLLRQERADGYDHPGFRVFDIADPANPREIAFQKTGGYGVHGLDFDGRYTVVSTEMEGYRGNILVNYDLADPTRPQEISRWHLPGQEAKPGEGTSPRGGVWLHHALRTQGKIWAAYWQAGVWVLDGENMTEPALLGSYNYHPPFFEPTHTVMGIPNKHEGHDLALVIDEEHDNHPPGQPHGALWVFDVTDPAAMLPISFFEVSELASPYSTTARFGAGQIIEKPTGDRVFATWFAGGLRVVDIEDPAKPTEIGYFIPPPAKGADAPQSMDVEIDDRGFIYLLDRHGALDILEMTN